MPSRSAATSRPDRRRSGLTPRGDATRRAIMDAALALFSAKGYHETSVPEIVRKAGVGHGTFYEYFSNRRDVLVALTQTAAERLMSIRRPVRPVSPAERVRQEIQWFLSDHVENLELDKIWTEAERFDPEVAAARRRLHEIRIKRVQRSIEMAAPPGVDPEVAAVALYSMLHAFIYEWYIERGSPTRPGDVLKAAETLSSLWLGAIGLA
jgi:AcrR family transcriptional regulator